MSVEMEQSIMSETEKQIDPTSHAVKVAEDCMGNKFDGLYDRQNEDDPFTIERAEDKEIRITLDEYKGKTVLCIRVWVKMKDRDWKPTHRGINLYPNEIPALIAACGLSLNDLFYEQDEGLFGI